MAYIVQRLTDSRLQLGREELLRKLPFGTNWNYIRLAALVQTNSSEAALANQTGFPLISFGMATGNSGMLSDTTVDYIGCAACGSATFVAGNWLSAASGALYSVTAQSTGAVGFQKIGSSNVTSVLQSTQYGRLPSLGSSGGSVIQRNIILGDFVKGTYTTGRLNPLVMSFWCPSSTANTVDVTPAQFFDQMQYQAAPTNLNYIGNPSITVVGAGAWDTAALMWGRSFPVLDVCAFAAIRYA